MTYTVTVSSRIFSSDDLQTLRTDFKLPLTEFRSINPMQMPNILTFLLEEDSTFDVDLSQYGAKLRLLALKASRPVYISMTNGTDTYNYPALTYHQLLLDSAEDLASSITTMTLTVPPAPTIAPTTLPPRYPKAVVELFALFE